MGWNQNQGNHNRSYQHKRVSEEEGHHKRGLLAGAAAGFASAAAATQTLDTAGEPATCKEIFSRGVAALWWPESGQTHRCGPAPGPVIAYAGSKAAVFHPPVPGLVPAVVTSGRPLVAPRPPGPSAPFSSFALARPPPERETRVPFSAPYGPKPTCASQRAGWLLGWSRDWMQGRYWGVVGWVVAGRCCWA